MVFMNLICNGITRKCIFQKIKRHVATNQTFTCNIFASKKYVNLELKLGNNHAIYPRGDHQHLVSRDSFCKRSIFTYSYSLIW